MLDLLPQLGHPVLAESRVDLPQLQIWATTFMKRGPTTPPLNTVPFIGGEDDPAWGPRPEVI